MDTSTPSLNVMIVDDSIAYRLILKEVMRNLPGVSVCATASNGKEALNKIQSLKNEQPHSESAQLDLVLLDLQMPVMDGLSTLNAIKRDYPDIGVAVISGFNQENAELTIKALESGAVDFIRKPDNSEMEQNYQELRQRLSGIIASCQEKCRTLKKSGAPATLPRTSAVPVHRQSILISPKARPLRKALAIEAVAIGISTGGPKALGDFIPNLPGDLNVPVFIVQHMPPYFTKSLAESLDKKSPLHVKEGEHGEIVKPNVIYIAPGGFHMEVKYDHANQQTCIHLQDNAPVNSCRPSADVLFYSVAKVYGATALSLIMTGMGNDGADGMKVMKEQGSYCITQSAESCVIYGMPRAADEMNLPDEQVDLQDLAVRITQLIKP